MADCWNPTPTELDRLRSDLASTNDLTQQKAIRLLLSDLTRRALMSFDVAAGIADRAFTHPGEGDLPAGLRRAMAEIVVALAYPDLL